MKHPDKQLSERHKEYIIKNHREMSVITMCRNLGTPAHRVRAFLNENGLDPITPEQWNARKFQGGSFFNVDEKKGEYTWLV